MANIQASINQAISLATLLATQSPALKDIGERNIALQKLTKQEKSIAQKEAALTGPQVLKNVNAAEKLYDEIVEEKFNIAKKRFDVDPSDETYSSYIEAYKEANPPSYTSEPPRTIEDVEEEDIIAAAQQADLEEAFKDKVAAYRQYPRSQSDIQREKADKAAREAQEQLMVTRKRILEGTPSEYILRGE